MATKTFLIIPPTGRYMRSDRCQAPVDTRVAEPARPPMDLAYMAAVLERQGMECKIKDYPMEGKGWDAAADDLRNFAPDILVINTTTPTIENDLLICDIAKKISPSMKTIAKGAHFLLFDKEILEKFRNLDIAMRGEAESTIREIAEGKDHLEISGIAFRRNFQIIRNPDRPFQDDLDALPYPARHLLNNRLYSTPDTNAPIAFVTASRGCPGKCVFCAAGIVSGYKLRTRSIPSVIGEIEECVKKYNIRDFFFSADTFTWDRKWVIDFCDEILAKNIRVRWGANSRADTIDDARMSSMKKAGCYVVGFGAESGSQFMLDKMKKGITLAQIESAVALCRRYGIQSYLHFMVGLPWETEATVNETVKFVKNTDASFIEVNIAYPLPGTEFYDIGCREGLFEKAELCGHDHTMALVSSFSLSTAQLRRMRKKVLRAFYLRPGYIVRRFAQVGSLPAAINYLKYALRLMRNLITT